MRGKHFQLNKIMSVVMAAAMSFSGMGSHTVLAEDMKKNDFFYVEERGQPGTYYLKLPYYEGCIYDYDETHEYFSPNMEPAEYQTEEKRDIILEYLKDEEIKLMVFPAENLEIQEFHLYDKDKEEPAYVWEYDTGKLEFFMPEKDLQLELKLAEKYYDMSFAGEYDEQPADYMEPVYYAENEEMYGPVDDNSVEAYEQIDSEDFSDYETEYLPAQAYVENEYYNQNGYEYSETPYEEESDYSAVTAEAPHEAYEIELETDGLPAQGSIFQMETAVIPFDTWDFNPETDFTNIQYSMEEYDITYISDDIIYDMPGTYNSIYRVQQKNTERMWYVLRPVRVADENEVMMVSEMDDIPEVGNSEDSSDEESGTYDGEITSSQGQSDDQIPDSESDQGQNDAQTSDTESDQGENNTQNPDSESGQGQNNEQIPENGSDQNQKEDQNPDNDADHGQDEDQTPDTDTDQEGTSDQDSADTESPEDTDLTLIISKKAADSQDELPGAELELRRITENGEELIEQWTTTEEEKLFVDLEDGTYTLKETKAPEGYALAEDMTFDVSDEQEIHYVEMIDELLMTSISKTDIVTGELLSGANLQITDAEGNVIQEWTSTAESQNFNLPEGEYTLSEIQAPEGYMIADPIRFSVDSHEKDLEITMYDAPIPAVHVSKKDIADGKELPGAELMITDEEGNQIDSWTSSDTPHVVILQPGKYNLVEVAAPADYLMAETMSFIVQEDDYKNAKTVTMYDARIPQIIISKKDNTTGKELSGAELILNDKEGNEIEAWMTEELPHSMMLKPGEYVLSEKNTPAGYATAENVSFTVAEDDYKEIRTITMYDQPLVVRFLKKDITNDKLLSNASLRIIDQNGQTVDEWISGSEPYELIMEKGEYTLLETTAPEGYEVSEAVHFEVLDTMEVQQVEMYDSPKEKLVDLTGKKKEVQPGNGGSGSYGSPAAYGDSGYNYTAAPVRTGDYNRYMTAFILILLGIGGASALLLTKGEKKKREDDKV